MSPSRADEHLRRHVEIGSQVYRVLEDEDAFGSRGYVHMRPSVHVARSDVGGDPAQENLSQDLWVWSLTEFSGGEGRIVFNPLELGPPHFRKTDGGIDVRTPGHFRLMPTMSVTTTPSSPRLVSLGTGNDVWAYHFDGTNTDIYRWNFSTNAFSQVLANAFAGEVGSGTNTDKYNYVANRESATAYSIWQHDAAAATKYTATHTFCAGIAFAADRLYALFDDGLYEITPDLTTGLPLAKDSADFQRVATFKFTWSTQTADFRQLVTSVGNGVRFLTVPDGGAPTVWEYSQGATQRRWPVPSGFQPSCIFHYGVTFIGGRFTQRVTSGPPKTRAALLFIDGNDQLRFLTYLRYEDPADEHVAYMAADGAFVYALQGNRLWVYDFTTGGITLDSTVGASSPSNTRSVVVMDTKKWVAIEGQGVSVSANSYPTSVQYLYSPIWDFGVSDRDKTLTEIQVVTAALPSNTSVQVDYQVNENGTWTSAGAASTSGSTHTWDLISSTQTVTFRTIQWRVGIRSTTGGANTPEVRSVSVKAFVNDYTEQFILTLALDDDERSRGGRARTGRDKARDLLTLVQDRTAVQFRDHYASRVEGDTDTYTVVVTDPIVELDSDGQGRARVTLKVV